MNAYKKSIKRRNIFPHDLYENKQTNAGIKFSCKTSKKTIKNKNGEQENGKLENAKKIW